MIPLTTVFLVIFLCSSFSFLSPPPTRRLILDGPASSRLLQSSVGPSSLPTQYTSEATTTRVPAQRKLVFSSSEKCWHKQQKRHPLLKRAHSPEEETPASHVLGRHHRPKVRLQQLRWLTLHIAAINTIHRALWVHVPYFSSLPLFSLTPFPPYSFPTFASSSVSSSIFSFSLFHSASL